MKRPLLVTLVSVLQVLLGMLLAGLSIYLLSLTRLAETLNEPDPTDAIHGLWIGAALLGLPGLVMLIAAWSLWKQRFWAWVLSLATDAGMVLVLIYDVVAENDHDTDAIMAAAGLLVPVILLLLPVVRKFYGHSPRKQSVILSARNVL